MYFYFRTPFVFLNTHIVSNEYVMSLSHVTADELRRNRYRAHPACSDLHSQATLLSVFSQVPTPMPCIADRTERTHAFFSLFCIAFFSPPYCVIRHIVRLPPCSSGETEVTPSRISQLLNYKAESHTRFLKSHPPSYITPSFTRRTKYL